MNCYCSQILFWKSHFRDKFSSNLLKFHTENGVFLLNSPQKVCKNLLKNLKSPQIWTKNLCGHPGRSIKAKYPLFILRIFSVFWFFFSVFLRIFCCSFFQISVFVMRRGWNVCVYAMVWLQFSPYISTQTSCGSNR